MDLLERFPRAWCDTCETVRPIVLDVMKAKEKHDHDAVHEYYLGPSLQWRPTQRMHVDFAPLFGLGGESNSMQLWLIAGWEF